MIKVKFSVRCQHGDGLRTLLLPGTNRVCPRCAGVGRHVNPAIDSHGISPEEFEEDPDFAEGYFSGRYDVPCEECAGERVVGDVNLQALPKALRRRIAKQMEQEAGDRMERRHYEQLAAAGIEF